MSRIVINGGSIIEIAEECVTEIKNQLPSRAHRSANVLRNSALEVLRGQRSGRMYGNHQASAPGEPPASKSGHLRISWEPHTYIEGNVYKSCIESPLGYAELLENGTPGGQMAPRPHHDRIKEDALPKIIRIYDEPYL